MGRISCRGQRGLRGGGVCTVRSRAAVHKLRVHQGHDQVDVLTVDEQLDHSVQDFQRARVRVPAQRSAPMVQGVATLDGWGHTHDE